MQAVSDFVKARPCTFALYGSFVIGAVLIYRSLQAQSTGQYDYVLTLSAGLQTLSFALLVMDTRSQAAEGISEKALWAFFIAHVSRLSTTFWGEGYVPEDNTQGFYLYQILETTGVVMLFGKLLNMTTLRTMHDVGQGMERWTMLIGMVAASVVLAYHTKSTGHDDFFADLLWMFSVWLEAFALLPQVQLLWKASSLDESAVHFAGLTLAASLAFAAFWVKNSSDHFEHFMKNENHLFMYGIVACAVIRVSLCACYFYLFTRHTKSFKGVFGAKTEYELCLQDEEL